MTTETTTTRYAIYNAHGLLQANVNSRRLSELTQIDALEADAAIENFGWCGTIDCYGDRAVVVGVYDTIPEEAEAYIAGTYFPG